MSADLANRLRVDLQAARAQARLVEQHLATLVGDPDGPAMAFMSVAIDRAYTALESLFARVAREIDGAIPSGDGWHASLLHQMTLAIQDRRPTLVTAETARLLDELRRHRHWLRHAYATTFEWPRMKAVTYALGDTIASAAQDLERFLAFLES